MERFNADGTPKKEKKGKKIGGSLIVLLIIAAIIVGSASSVITYQNEYKLIRQFGKVQTVITEPGFSLKIPFVQTVDTIPKEIQLYDLPPGDVITSDKKTMIIDSYVLWKVTDPLKFAQTLGGSIGNAEGRIDSIVYNATKNTISNMKQDEVIMSRDGKMTITAVAEESDVESNDIVMADEDGVVEITSLTESIMAQINSVESQYGIEIITVDAKKLDLPDDNKQAVYTRMISERENIAATYTAEGTSEAQIIKNSTDKEVSIMISEAEKQAEILKAEGEAEYMKILSDAYADESKTDFYSFVRSLDAVKASITGENKTVILSEDSPIAQIFNGQ